LGFLNLFKKGLIAACVAAIAGCVQIPSPVERKKSADDLAAQHAWVDLVIESEGYFLQTYRRKLSLASGHLVVYLEGDGLAWYSSTNPSSRTRGGSTCAACAASAASAAWPERRATLTASGGEQSRAGRDGAG
jgi:hypothetical protein